MSNRLVLSWRNPDTRTWSPVGILEFKNELYSFYYTNGAKADNFVPFGQMQNKVEKYVSDSLFPIFQNRLLSKSRPEYSDFLDWLDINKDDNNEILELSRSRGIRATDDLQLFPIPERNEKNEYSVFFFSHGISHISKSYIERLSSLKKNDRLLIMRDIQNEVDDLALTLRTHEDPIELMGYCPAFFVKDFNKLLNLNGQNNVEIKVQKINEDAPLQLKLLCKLTTKWPENFEPFDENEFSPYS
jgi:hypothetical protein